MALFQGIARWILESRPARQTTKRFISWNDVRHILLLAPETALQQVSGFVGQAEKEGKTVTTVFIHKGKPEQVPAFDHPHVVVSKKQLTVLGLPQQDVLSTLGSKKAELLINLGTPDDTALLALSKWTDVPCKMAGFGHPVYDISISADMLPGKKEFLDQVMIYLHMIKS